MKKLGRLLLICIFLVSSVHVISAGTFETNSTPVINSVEANATMVTIGETITMTINVTGDDGIMDFYGSIRATNGTHYKNLEYVNFELETTGNWSGHIVVQEYWPDWDLYLEYLEIYNGNWYYYNNGSDYISPEIYLYNTNPDVEPPTVNSVWFSHGSATPNTTVTVFISASDDVSGLSDWAYGELHFFNSTHGIYEKWLNFVFVTDSGYYEATFTVGQYWLSGFYYIPYVQLYDRADNYDVYYNSSDYNSGVFEAYDTTPDNTTPVFNSMSFSQKNATTNNYLTLNVNASDDLAGISYGDAELYLEDGSYVTWFSLFYDDSTGTLVGDVYIDNWVPIGSTLYVRYLSIYDNAGNSIFKEDGYNNFTSPRITVEEGAPPQEEEISVSVNPNWSSSFINEQVEFKIQIESTFTHDMMGIQLQFYGSGPAGDAFFFNTYFDLYANDYFTTSYTVDFNDPGNYDITAEVIDDIDYIWRYSFQWEVIDDDTVSEDTGSDGNDSITPGIQLPGFELTFTVVSLSTIIIATYSKRRY